MPAFTPWVGSGITRWNMRRLLYFRNIDVTARLGKVRERTCVPYMPLQDSQNVLFILPKEGQEGQEGQEGPETEVRRVLLLLSVAAR